MLSLVIYVKCGDLTPLCLQSAGANCYQIFSVSVFNNLAE